MTEKEIPKLSKTDIEQLDNFKIHLYLICVRYDECEDCPFGRFKTCPYRAIQRVLHMSDDKTLS